MLNPATDEVLGTLPYMGASETRRAIDATDKAQSAWAAKSGIDEYVETKYICLDIN